MDDLKSVTVNYLRKLARKHLGPGHSKLRTKVQLLGALAAVVPALAVLAKLAGVKVSGAKKAAHQGKAGRAQESAVEGRQSTVTDEKKAVESDEQPSAPEGRKPNGPVTKPAQVVNFPPRPRPASRPETETEPIISSTAAFEAPQVESAPPGTPPPAAPPIQHAAEPLVEGFFVARVRGSEEARRHHLTEEEGRHDTSGWRGYEENLGELSHEAADDMTVALPRDPHSLYVLWAFSNTTRNRALDGLEAPRAVLRVFDGETLVREEDFALESRGFYIQGLPAGRPYRVEAHFVGRDGRSRRIGHSTNRVVLPPVGPSTDTSVRFMRMPLVMPAAGVQPPAPPPAPARTTTTTTTFEEREYITWRRVPLPGSGGFEDLPETRRERTASETGPGPGPGAPAPQHLEFTARPQGSSEQQYLEAKRAPGSSEQQYLEASRPAGASEHRYLEVRRAEGSSDQTAWTPPPSGRGR
jgi:hypothetical protein